MNNTRSTFSTFGGAAPREPAGNQVSSELTVCEARELLYNAALLLSELNQICLILKQDVESEKGWPELFARAMTVKKQLQEKLHRLEDPHILEKVKKKLTSVRKKRERVRRKKTTRLLEKEDQEFRMAEIDERINKWRNQRVQIVEEKKREQELKVAADSVLSEVRKKQVDIKRMVDILKSLEKLRRLRKEAASRKGVYPECSANEQFEEQILNLRKVFEKRTALYNAEEKALRVMLESEREEERKRDLERKLKKEKDRQLHKKREFESAFFGDSAEIPPNHPLYPFRQYYLQGEHSLSALVNIRKDWDCYLTPAEHPSGSNIPRDWVFPSLPSSDIWATAIEKQISFFSQDNMDKLGS
ncbi:programmed cell death protein 7 [Erpetoichthys calabaricus]|uniref:programmed cell death protein 7 n=1 Tax=Erpetoichthys calabaricus TaxID=27687 RepID=UPI002234A0FE|nr:programmed cell death protein 7 [Erpetoichthys calabaricus]